MLTNEALQYDLSSTAGSIVTRSFLPEQDVHSDDAVNEDMMARNDTSSSQQNWSFPRWEGQGISFQSMQSFVQAMPMNTTTLRPASLYQLYPELLYILDGSGIRVSTNRRQLIRKADQRYRVYPMEEAMRLAFVYVKQKSTHKWPRIRQALKKGGFPFIVWHGDFQSCNLNNYQNQSVPLFTVCGKISCQHSFPIPTYKTILDSQPSALHWAANMAEYQRDYPWETKIRKVVWRGGLTGALDNYTSDRARIARFPVEHPSSWLDIGLTGIPPRHDKANIQLSYFNGLAQPLRPQESFQNFIGILDIDGNSWSSRFGKLLCYNSVILKVEPRYIDYFYKSLKPWVHFIPVQHDLSDLLDKAEYVVDPANQYEVQEVISNANQWCREHMIQKTIAHDYLDIWEEYLYQLDRGDPSWAETWIKWKPKLLNASGLNMQRLTGTLRRVQIAS